MPRVFGFTFREIYQDCLGIYAKNLKKVGALNFKKYGS